MKKFVLGIILTASIVGMIFIFSKEDERIYRYLPEGKYEATVISVRVKGDETLREILINNEEKTGMKGVPVNIQVKEWERFSGRDADYIDAGEDILLPCYIKIK